jgi:CheY-like chemotaxis protein
MVLSNFIDRNTIASSGRSSGVGMSKVLVVNADSEVRAALSGLLQAQDFSVQEARNCLEALGMLQAERDIDLVLLDIVMPEMDGFKFSTEAWRVRPAIPMLFLTNMPILLEGADVLGDVAYCLKPYQPEELVKRLRLLADAATGPNQTQHW